MSAHSSRCTALTSSEILEELCGCHAHLQPEGHRSAVSLWGVSVPGACSLHFVFPHIGSRMFPTTGVSLSSVLKSCSMM